MRALDGVSVSAFENDLQFVIVTTPELSEKAAYLYDAIKTVTRSDRNLSIPLIQEYLESLHFSGPKANRIPQADRGRFGDKADIILTSRDSSDRAQSTEGFSVKSYLGSNPTLFNAAEASRLIYKIEGCTVDKMHHINSQSDFLLIVNAIKADTDLKLVFMPDKVHEDFSINLEKVDTKMIDIIDALLRIQCGLLDGANSSSISDLTEKLASLNPLNNRDPYHYYVAKIKDFLFDSFAGLTAARRWDARKKLTGGYIEVDADGEILYYRAMSDDVFSTYLYNTTKIDRPDRGLLCELACAQGKAYCEERTLTEDEIYVISHKPDGRKKTKRCNYGYVYQEGNEFFFSLNFQIRFK